MDMITNTMIGNFSYWQPIQGQRKRSSSYDRTGGNQDFIVISPGETKAILVYRGSQGFVLRLWFTFGSEDPAYLHNTKISMSFDGEETVSKVPIGMFCATGPWAVNDVCSLPINVTKSNLKQGDPGYGSFNLNWRMPFANEVTIRIHNDSTQELKQYYYVDYLVVGKEEKDILLFHATYNCALTHQSPGIKEGKERQNLSDTDNYVFAEINNYKGNYVGTVLAVESTPDRFGGKWYWGDDMFFLDGETWPPSLHGTGTEDYFGLAMGIKRKYQSWDHGVSHFQQNITDHDRFFDGRYVLYRWHFADPIVFERSVRASIEAGHANECEQQYESVAFWYGKMI